MAIVALLSENESQSAQSSAVSVGARRSDDVRGETGGKAAGRVVAQSHRIQQGRHDDGAQDTGEGPSGQIAAPLFMPLGRRDSVTASLQWRESRRG